LAGKIKFFKQKLLTATIAKKFLKKRRMRILSARTFGGKIKHGQTDVNKETTFTKKN